MALVLFAYFGTMLMVHIPWDEVAWGLRIPTVDVSKDYISVVVAVLGTTISPYLFFWQSSQEAEDQREQPQRAPLVGAPEQAPNAFARIRLDTYIGMGFSNLVAIAIIITAAATLHVNGPTDVQTAQQAAEALNLWRAISPSWCLRSASSVLAAWRCRCWPDRRPMRSAKRCGGR
jgi:Mn2+/Fe2+ NRAMP family transporter